MMKSEMNLPRLLVLDGEQRSALAVVRSLGSKGGDILVGSASASSLAGCSRYCRKQVQYRDPFEHPLEYCEDLFEIIEQEQIEWLLPMTDLSMNLVLDHRARFGEKVLIPCETKETYNHASDKVKLVKLALEIGVPVPASRIFANQEAVYSYLGEIKYPLVLKPGFSILTVNGKLIKTVVRIIETEDALIHLLKNDAALSQPFLLQEKVPGQGTGIFALCRNGEAIAIFSHRRLREKPPWGGVSVLCESALPDPHVRDDALKLLKALKWNGVAMVEFKYDPESKKHYLMEINARFWGSLQLAIDAGIDFPYLLCRIYRNQNVSREMTYGNARLRWLLGDLDSCYLALKHAGRLRYQKRRTAVLQFIKEFFMGSRFQILRRDDVNPFFHELRRYVKDVLPK